MFACAKGFIDIIKIMLTNKNIDINMRDPRSGVNAIWLACLYGHGDVINLLAKANADIFSTNNRKINMMHLAVYKNY
jgi:ankyrin repeat protein